VTGLDPATAWVTFYAPEGPHRHKNAKPVGFLPTGVVPSAVEGAPWVSLSASLLFIN